MTCLLFHIPVESLFILIPLVNCSTAKRQFRVVESITTISREINSNSCAHTRYGNKAVFVSFFSRRRLKMIKHPSCCWRKRKTSGWKSAVKTKIRNKNHHRRKNINPYYIKLHHIRTKVEVWKCAHTCLGDFERFRRLRVEAG